MAKPLEIYIHIPFCVAKCEYCDFFSAPSKEAERRAYVKSLCQEIVTYRSLAKAYSVSSIFLGGGTPSVLEEGLVTRLLEAVFDTFSVEEQAEISLEMNPGTVSKQKLREYRQAGINRLSMGLQSVHQKELEALGRIHTCREGRQTYEMAREEGFGNVNIDMMSGIPFQTLSSWEESLHTVAGWGPEHLSAYSLIIEEGTPFFYRYQKEQEDLPGEEEERRMYAVTEEILRGYGYRRYEISNYGKPGFYCRHNLGYWDRVEYLGFGKGAASFLGEERWSYQEERKAVTRREQMEEYMFLGLRKMEGVSQKRFQKLFGISMKQVYGKEIEKFLKLSLLEEKGDMVRLSREGISVSNEIFCAFLLDD
ncbi:radical SAM family heme chaperone HemW [Clostridiaceae bacterium 68-1-5]|uniref:Heme chaperone HemW n=1 Tax=Suipraeoptans intestinalis TaxID=2606628 RepID=A0A6N7URB7_9FIRM|nr:radical SAM family heme chaperone HemW [Suipraeoptans intestinalis]